MDALLTPAHEALLEAERNLLARLHGVLTRKGADASLRERLSEVIETLDALFVVVRSRGVQCGQIDRFERPLRRKTARRRSYPHNGPNYPTAPRRYTDGAPSLGVSC